jgi:hypothetical protein
MYGQFYEPNLNANSTQPISQIAHNIRHGLNGPAIIAPNDEHMAHQHQHIPQSQSQQHHVPQQQQQQQHHQPQSQPQPQPQRQNSKQDKDRINVLAIPATTVVGSKVIIGDASSSQFSLFNIH